MSDPRDWPEHMKAAARRAEETVRQIEARGARDALLDLAKELRQRAKDLDFEARMPHNDSLTMTHFNARAQQANIDAAEAERRANRTHG